ncbi:VRR-NUC domain-containing protein [Acidaminococcus fermentans]|uniref:VRR-NUC domain-containing protein n=1 Tax=Acidaminococcus fermentans TaxID=905 RepID=UPI002E7704A7|nr:VRR-NUC domain-containing protein [Acidaminococcus fermentans]MEE1597234.1 VRR-NUC domain-containing protein [Acidaminococcus fermentans]MEE4121503.1 VRR-NUC domain-containing protein [Acidaminococcus fermentans]
MKSEKQIELKLVTETRKKGGLALKFVSPSYAGMPDRLVLFPHGKLAFVEVKAPGKMPRVLQEKRHGMLRALGFQVFVLDSLEDIPGLLQQIAEGGDAQ